MGHLTTHILDTARGKPGSGIQIELFRLNDARQLIATAVSNVDGRTDEPLLGVDDFVMGTYEIIFKVGEYFSTFQTSLDGPPPFLDEIPIRFTLSAEQHYHVPLLVTPWSYSTYRGS